MGKYKKIIIHYSYLRAVQALISHYKPHPN